MFTLTIHYTATLTKGTESTANGKIAIMSDTDFNPTEAEKPENYTVSVESAARSGSVTVSSAADAHRRRRLDLHLILYPLHAGPGGGGLRGGYRAGVRGPGRRT